MQPRRSEVPSNGAIVIRVVALFALLAVLVLLQGCTSWQRRPFSPRETAAIRADRPVRVLQSNGTMVTLERSHVVGDSMIGDIERTDIRYAVALGDISRLEHKQISLGRTVGLPLVWLGAVTLAASAFLVMAVFVGSRA